MTYRIFVDSRVENFSGKFALKDFDDVFLKTFDGSHVLEDWDQGSFVCLNAGQNGIDQMVRGLQGATDLDAIHIVSHGISNQLLLGSTVR